jgi:hypothetical protein
MNASIIAGGTSTHQTGQSLAAMAQLLRPNGASLPWMALRALTHVKGVAHQLRRVCAPFVQHPTDARRAPLRMTAGRAAGTLAPSEGWDRVVRAQGGALALNDPVDWREPARETGAPEGQSPCLGP